MLRVGSRPALQAFALYLESLLLSRCISSCTTFGSHVHASEYLPECRHSRNCASIPTQHINIGILPMLMSWAGWNNSHGLILEDPIRRMTSFIHELEKFCTFICISIIVTSGQHFPGHIYCFMVALAGQ